MLPNLNKHYLLTNAVHKQMDKTDNIPLLKKKTFTTNHLKQRKPMVTQSKMSNKMVQATSQNKKTTITINTAK